MAQARSMVLVMLAPFPMSEGNDQVAADILDAKWRPIDSEFGNVKRIAGKSDRLELAVENVDLTGLEVGGVQVRANRALYQGTSLVYGVAGIVYRDHGMRSINTRVPS